MENAKMKKFFSSKSAKGIALFVAVLLIGAAVYVNYKLFYNHVDSMGFGEGSGIGSSDGSEQTGGSAGESDNYFKATALNRQQSRDEAIDVLKMVTESNEASEEAKANATAQISKIATDIQNEVNIETLVKAKGFDECVAVIAEDSVSVIVDAEKLQAAQAAQILSIVMETTGISPDKVSIINK